MEKAVTVGAHLAVLRLFSEPDVSVRYYHLQTRLRGDNHPVLVDLEVVLNVRGQFLSQIEYLAHQAY